jgi:peptidoglycan/LPS O-acetylase OafA/YrhL
MPGLDGMRAIAVLGVILYHLEFGWAEGGCSVWVCFFTLSGYLITDILLNQVNGGGIKLKSFWLARARRLLPGLFVMLTVVMAWVTLIGPHQPPDFRTAALSAAGYVNNWWLVLHDVSYFARFAPQSPLNHLWSLSVEEQFYIVLAVPADAGPPLRPGSGAKTGVRPRLAAVTVGAALALRDPDGDPLQPHARPLSRLLRHRHPRASSCSPARRWRCSGRAGDCTARIAPQARRTIEAAGVVGLAVIGLMFWQTSEFSPFLYRGGFAVLALASVARRRLARPTRPPGSARSSAAGRCAGSASAPTASTSGPCRSSS